MTLVITKTKLSIAILAMALLVPATAFATHTFTDVPTDAFYHDAAEWAKTNDITTGSPAGSDTFKPEDPVTRGESVVFLNRYDTNIVQPALTTLTGTAAANSAAIVANDVDIAAMPTLQWATINSNGTIAAASSGVNSGVGETNRIATGNYEVDFLVADVAACHAMASFANTNIFFVGGGSIEVVARNGDTSSLFVFTKDTTANAADFSFTVQLWC